MEIREEFRTSGMTNEFTLALLFPICTRLMVCAPRTSFEVCVEGDTSSLVEDGVLPLKDQLLIFSYRNDVEVILAGVCVSLHTPGVFVHIAFEVGPYRFILSLKVLLCNFLYCAAQTLLLICPSTCSSWKSGRAPHLGQLDSLHPHIQPVSPWSGKTHLTRHSHEIATIACLLWFLRTLKHSWFRTVKLWTR